jgi:hypothetical protein
MRDPARCIYERRLPVRKGNWAVDVLLEPGPGWVRMTWLDEADVEDGVEVECCKSASCVILSVYNWEPNINDE